MDWATMTPLLGALTTVPDWSSITSVIASLGALAGVVYVGSRTRKSTQEANDTARESTAVATAQALWARVDEVDQDRKKDRQDWEDERDQLRGRLDSTTTMLTVSLEYIEDLVQDIRAAGARIVRRPPRELRDRLGHIFHTDPEEG